MYQSIKLSGKKIRQLRNLWKISQEDLACEIYTERRTISRIESDLQGVNLTTAVKLSRFFNVKIDDLLS
jgi:DNA-binding XRE family transcriptional regulator